MAGSSSARPDSPDDGQGEHGSSCFPSRRVCQARDRPHILFAGSDSAQLERVRSKLTNRRPRPAKTWYAGFLYICNEMDRGLDCFTAGKAGSGPQPQFHAGFTGPRSM